MRERRRQGRRRRFWATAGGERGPAGGRMSVGLRWGGAMTAGRSPQAKYLAQIILVGAQVVGRAFMRALRQEFAGRS